MELEQFIETFAEVTEVTPGEFGHHPFNLYFVNKDGHATFAALAAMDTKGVFTAARTLYLQGCKILYLTMDLTPIIDIKTDFVAIISVVDGNFDSLAIPYNNKTGRVSERQYRTAAMAIIESQFKQVLTAHKIR